ncbi:MAG: helix-turn-helix transcriptional regulator [Clostridia bacterium]|nr:helix-turn-helix transcriptional regulator [Clostridia bacterium]
MKRVIIGNQLQPSQFIENIPFTEAVPYYLCIKRFANDDITIPHYADTIELLLCDDDIRGVYIADKTQYVLNGRCVLYCPPNCVHRSHYEKGDGTLYVLKISYKHLKEYVNLEKILNNTGNHTIFCEPFMCYDFDKVFPEIQRLIQKDGEELSCIQSLINIFDILKDNMKKSDAFSTKPADVEKNDHLSKLIDYSEEHFLEGLSNQTAAKFVGYNEAYFCRWFVKKTGMTYNNYLMNLKINYACRMLTAHVPVSEIVEELGYANVSFFIRKFKEYMGCTPGAYVKRVESERTQGKSEGNDKEN